MTGVTPAPLKRITRDAELDLGYASRVEVPVLGPEGQVPVRVLVRALAWPAWATATVTVAPAGGGAFASAVVLSPGSGGRPSASAVLDDEDGVAGVAGLLVTQSGTVTAGDRVRLEVTVEYAG